MSGPQYRTQPGRRYPFGATRDARGANFSVFSRHATGAQLLLFEKADSATPFQVITLDPEVNRTFFSWHVYVVDLPAGIYYGWRIDGPYEPHRGMRFDRHKVLLDPSVRAVSQRLWDRGRAARPGDNVGGSMRGILVDDPPYDWQGDRPLNHPLENTIIYEMHVGGFTRHSSSGVEQPGTFAGLIEKIPYLQELGVTDVELMPVMAFDEQDVPGPAAALGLRNYWGYSPHSFFVPHPGYCVNPEQGANGTEFRDLVKALHRAGIGVILDVVFNHTAEGGADGPTINFKGLGNAGFYHLDPDDRSRYRDFTGCGNTVNCSHPVICKFLVECLEYWVREMHVDGFRFDLASVLARDQDGNPMYYAPLPWNIEFSDTLAHTTLIAEAWDAGGLYQVGDFPGFRWAEWNGRYRDVVRRFVRGEPGLIGELATRLAGSSDFYEANGRLPINSINFITCHDGFTLHDLVSYEEKHNAANGQDNEDGGDANFSCNYGEEGETDGSEILALRHRQARNFMAILLLSQGVPMLLAGDEILRTQRGNNNCYCQDNELSWLHWEQTEQNRPMLRFVREMIAFRKRHPCLLRKRFLTGKPAAEGRLADITWHGREPGKPLWDDPQAQMLGFTLSRDKEWEEDVHVILNMSERSAAFTLPGIDGRRWCRTVDTWQEPPDDICTPSGRRPVDGSEYLVRPRSVAVFETVPITHRPV